MAFARTASVLKATLATVAMAILGCGDADSGPGTETAPTDATSGIATIATTSTSTSTGPATETEGPPEVLCPAIDVSLVVDPRMPATEYYTHPALAALFNDLVWDTGATVRVLPNVGAEGVYTGSGDCFAELPDGGPILEWGRDFSIDAKASDALECLLEEFEEFEHPDEKGDGMFAGLMFPLLLEDDWPSEGALGIPMLLARYGNKTYGLGGMYNRPRRATEAYLRLVADDDRRRALAFTWGEGSDHLPLFGLSLNEHSHHVEAPDTNLPDALAAFTETAVAACAAHDEPPPLEETIGCERIDILFVIDGSLSMEEEQEALQGLNGNPPVFAEFTDAMIDKVVDVEDFHVGVLSAQPDDTVLHTHGGAPLDEPAPENDCGLPPGQRWLVGPSDTLAEDFACLAGTRSEAVEVPTRNVAEALHNPANAGFLRDDSLLIVVVLTDEDEQSAALTSMEIRESILESVGGDLSRVLVLGIAGSQGVYEMPKTTCKGVYGLAVPGRRLTSIVYSFRERGYMQDICEGDLASTFEQLLTQVVSICTPEP